jgi:hypothetical protein
MAAAAAIGGMSFASLRQLAVTACCCGSSVSFLWAVLMQVCASAPQTAGRLFAITPDVAELLEFVALCKSILGSISLHPVSNVAGAWQTENFLRLCCPRQSYREQGQVYDFGFPERLATGGCHLLDPNNVEAEAHQPVRNNFRWGVVRWVAYHRLYGLSD